GDARLGGDDFDAALAERLAARIKEEQRLDVRTDPRAWARIKSASEDAKKRLSEAASASFARPDVPLPRGRSLHVQATFTRDEAEECWAQLLERMRVPILRAMRDARIGPETIDEVLLVGGSTRMPCVARLAAQVFGKLPLRKLPPDEAIAMGAAVQGA